MKRGITDTEFLPYNGLQRWNMASFRFSTGVMDWSTLHVCFSITNVDPYVLVERPATGVTYSNQQGETVLCSHSHQRRDF